MDKGTRQDTLVHSLFSFPSPDSRCVGGGGERREKRQGPRGGGRETRGWAEKGKKNKSFVRARSENRMVQTVEKLFLPFLSGLI